MREGFGQYVLKVASRCDLACDHCYVYEHADQSWRGRPERIDLAVVRRAADRIAEHAGKHDLSSVVVVLHGGEPLLLGHAGIRTVLTELRTRIAPVTALELGVHTNAVRLDAEFCEIFAEFGVKVGVSLDGDRAANDLHRRYRNGRSSHAPVLAGLALLREWPDLYGGILCTIDLSNDPDSVYRAVAAERPPRLDFLLPLATWENPPPRPDGAVAPYAEWLGRVYRRWQEDGQPMPIRLFDSVLSAARGGPSWSESLGVDPVDLLVIETDGAWEQSDSLKTAFEGAPATGMSIFTHSVDDVAVLPAVRSRQAGLAGLSETCRNCRVVEICGGGLYAHRYRAGSGFANPSVYCADLMALIDLVVSGAPPHHDISDRALDTLAGGAGDGPALEELAGLQESLTRGLVAAVGAAAGEPLAAAGWQELCRLDAAYPEAVRRTFAHPHVAAWAVRCLDPPAEGDPVADRRHLAALAAAASLRAGLVPEVPVPVRDGFAYLPGLGAIAAPDGAVHVAETGGPGWLPLRTLALDGLTLAIEDLDPFRDCYEWPAAGRAGAAEAEAWEALLTDAWAALRRCVPAYAGLMAAHLRSLVPLVPPPPDESRSGAVRFAFGAVAAARPGDGDTLAELLLHEFQHVKLDALLEGRDLVRPGGARVRVPWRGDPRPAEGVLHGTYAFLGVAAFWRARAAEDPGHAERSARLRGWVGAGLDALTNCGRLTPSGERFVRGMAITHDGW